MIASLLCAAALAVPQVDKDRLELRLPSGTVIESRLSMTFQDSDPDSVLITRDEFKSTVEFKEGEFVFNHLITPTFLKIGMVERPPAEALPAEVKDFRSKSGALKRYEGTVIDPQANTMLARFWTLPLPSVKPILGNEWTFTDHREFMPYSFKGTVTKDLGERLEVAVKFTGGNGDPMTAKGTSILDKKSGLPLKVELKVENGLAPGAEGERVPITYLFETTNIKFPS